MKSWLWLVPFLFASCAGINQRPHGREIAPGLTEQEVLVAKGEPSSKQTRWKDGQEMSVWTYTEKELTHAPNAPGADSLASPFGYPVPGPQPMQTQPTVYGDRTVLIVNFTNGRVTDWRNP